MFSQKLAIRPHPPKINPIHVLPFSFFKVHFTITIRPVYLLQFLQRETSLLYPTFHVLRQSDHHSADHPSNV